MPPTKKCTYCHQPGHNVLKCVHPDITTYIADIEEAKLDTERQYTCVIRANHALKHWLFHKREINLKLFEIFIRRTGNQWMLNISDPNLLIDCVVKSLNRQNKPIIALNVSSRIVSTRFVMANTENETDVMKECDICYESKSIPQFHALECSHSFCSDCVLRLDKSNTNYYRFLSRMVYYVACPMCRERSRMETSLH